MSEDTPSRPTQALPPETRPQSARRRAAGEAKSHAEEPQDFDSRFDTPSVQEEYRDKAHEYTGKARDAASQYRERTRSTLETGRQRAADGMERGARLVLEGSEQTSRLSAEQGKKAAANMEDAAGYLRAHTTDEIWNDFEGYMRQHPAPVLGGALFTGFLIGRMLR